MVDLSWNGLGNEAGPALGELFKQNHILLELNISSNRITLGGVTAMVSGLSSNETLTVLKVKLYCGILQQVAWWLNSAR